MPESAVIEHLKLIEGVITRMAGNSFLLKGWTVTLVSALFALAIKEGRRKLDHRFLLIALIPVLAFALLDMYYLWQERLFRDLYNHVRTSRTGDFSLNPGDVGEKKHGYWSGLCSYSVWPFYGSVVLLVGAVWAYVRFGPEEG